MEFCRKCLDVKKGKHTKVQIIRKDQAHFSYPKKIYSTVSNSLTQTVSKCKTTFFAAYNYSMNILDVSSASSLSSDCNSKFKVERGFG